MFKALLKKQMMEIFSFIIVDRRKGKRRSTGAAIGFGLLFSFLLVYLGAMFYVTASTLCEAFVPNGLGWLYFALMGLAAMLFGVFGSVFSTYSSMYAAKDNELLFSLPVKPQKVLFVRLSGVFVTGSIYELVVLIPTLIAYYVNGSPSAVSIALSLLVPVLLSFIVLGISCILGWLVAAVGKHVRNKTAVTVVLSIAFFVGYYYFFSQSYRILQKIIETPDGISRVMQTYIYPLYKMGQGAVGSVSAMLIFALIACSFLAIVLYIVAKSYYRFIISSQSNAARSKANFSEKAITAGSQSSALFRKELRRFLSSANYIMNCGLGIIFIIAAAVALFIKGGSVMELLTKNIGLPVEAVAVLLTAACCTLSSMNTITAPSVSLEGKSIWLAQSLPADPRAVLNAKLKLQLVLTIPPLALLLIALLFTVKPPVMLAALIVLLVIEFGCFMAVLGLMLNLRSPNLNWTNEVVPIKQSMPVLLTILIPWGAIAAFIGLFFLTRSYLPGAVFLLITCIALGAIDLLLYRWIRTKGAERFSELG